MQNYASLVFIHVEHCFSTQESSTNVQVAHGTLCNVTSVFIATIAKYYGCKYYPWQIQSVSAKPLAAARQTSVENH